MSTLSTSAVIKEIKLIAKDIKKMQVAHMHKKLMKHVFTKTYEMASRLLTPTGRKWRGRLVKVKGVKAPVGLWVASSLQLINDRLHSSRWYAIAFHGRKKSKKGQRLARKIMPVRNLPNQWNSENVLFKDIKRQLSRIAK